MPGRGDFAIGDAPFITSESEPTLFQRGVGSKNGNLQR